MRIVERTCARRAKGDEPCCCARTSSSETLKTLLAFFFGGFFRSRLLVFFLAAFSSFLTSLSRFSSSFFSSFSFFFCSGPRQRTRACQQRLLPHSCPGACVMKGRKGVPFLLRASEPMAEARADEPMPPPKLSSLRA